MEIESERSDSFESKGTKTIFGVNTGSLITFAILFMVLFQVYNKGNGKRSKKTGKGKGDEEEYLGIHDLPKVKNVVPFKLIGCIPRLLPLSRLFDSAEKISNEYGDLFFGQGLMMDFVIFNSGPTLQTLLKSADFAHLKKLPLMYQPLAPFVTNGLLVSNGVFWQRQRKILIKSQSYSNIKAYASMLTRHGNDFIEQLEELFADGKPHTINAPINTTFLAIITEMITGKNMGRSEELKRYHHNFNFWKDTVVLRVFNPLLLLKPIWFFHPRSKTHDKAEAELMEFARKRLEEHKEKRAKQEIEKESNSSAFRSVLDELLDAGIDERQIIDEIDVMMFGGHETGATTLHCLLFALAAHPEIQELARKEVDEFFDDPRTVKDGVISYDAVQSHLKYVERCIFETLRLFPPVFIQGRQLEKPLKVEYKDKTVLLPTGTNVFVSPFVLHRRPDYFPEPKKFDPDRFLPEESANRHAYSYIPFSAGPRNCLGLRFAQIELKTITAQVLRHFELSTTDKFDEVKLLPYATLTPSKDFTFELKRRIVK